MASKKRRKKGKRRFPSHLRKYWFKKKGSRKRRRKGTRHMARRKQRRRKHHRRHHHRRGRRRASGGGGHGGWMPSSEDLKLFAAGAVIGVAESKAKADANFPLNKIPRPVTALGYTGGTALALWAGGKLIGGAIGRYARLGARAAAVAAAYQMGKQGAAFTTVAVQGDDWATGDERYIDDYTMGALQTEAEQLGVLPFEGSVHQAGAHT